MTTITVPQPGQTTDYTTIEPPAKETVKPSTEAPQTTKKITTSTIPPKVISTAPPTALPTAQPTVSSKVATKAPTTSSKVEPSELSKLGEMENLIEELNFQNKEIQIQLQNYRESSENWDSTKENFQMGVFMSVMIIFLCFLLSKVCKLPFLGRVKYGAL